MIERDRYSQVAFRVAQLLLALPAKQRPPDLILATSTGLWKQITSRTDGARRKLAIDLFARLNPVGLCREVKRGKSLGQFVLNCTISAVPQNISRSEGIIELLDPSMRARVELEYLSKPTAENIESNKRIFLLPAASEDQ